MRLSKKRKKVCELFHFFQILLDWHPVSLDSAYSVFVDVQVVPDLTNNNHGLKVRLNFRATLWEFTVNNVTVWRRQ